MLSALPSLLGASSLPADVHQQEIDLLWHIEQQAARIDDVPSVLEYLTRRAVQLLGGEAGMIGLPEADGRMAVTFFRQPPLSLDAVELPPVEIRHTHLPATHHGLLHWVLTHEQPLRTNNIPHDPRVSGQGAALLGMALQHAVLVPLHHATWDPETRASSRRVFGVLAVLNKNPPWSDTGFARVDEELLCLVASHAARALAQAQERAERLRQHHLATLGSLVAGLLHDVRSPLMAILGFSQAMVHSDDKEERLRCAHWVEQQSERLQAMIQEVLSFAKGTRPLLIRRVTIPAFLEQLVPALQQELGDLQLDIQAHYRGEVWMDEIKMVRLIHNLARNARQAMPHGGWFRIVLEHVPGFIRWTFADNGPGIPPEIQARLFEPFHSHKPGGTGLGLALVKKMVEDQKGTLQVSSSAEHGTTFVINLPHKQTEPFVHEKTQTVL